LGAKVGYDWSWSSILLGVQGFHDAHGDSYTKDDAGLDARLGLPMNRWLPYAKLGVVGTTPGERLHGGLGVEYSLADSWAINAEWTTDSKDANGSTLKNNNIAFGLSYRFGGAGKAAAEKAAADKAAAEKAAADKLAADKAAADKAAADKLAAEKAAADKASATKAAPTYKTISYDTPITLEGTSFASGSAKLNKSAATQLDDVAGFLAKNKEANLTVVGYTDDRGDAKKNEKLSAARAEAVKAYLVTKGVAAERIATKGEGAAKPVADNKTAEGRAKNRRVEIGAVVKETKRVQVQ
jgi:OOP family OmpA-OmpF porin